MVLLTGKEHYLIHRLLVHIHKNDKRKHFQMMAALHAFLMTVPSAGDRRYIIPSSQMNIIRTKYGRLRKGRPGKKGHKMSDDSRRKMRDNHWTHNPKFIHGMLGREHTEESKERMAQKSCKYEYRCVAPDGTIYITRRLKKFLFEHDLSVDMREMNGKPIPPVHFRWSKRATSQRHNSVGWSFTFSSI